MSELAVALKLSHARFYASASFGRTVQRAPAEASNLLLKWQERARARHALSALDEHLLHDLGIEIEKAMREGARPFWKP